MADRLLTKKNAQTYVTPWSDQRTVGTYEKTQIANTPKVSPVQPVVEEEEKPKQDFGDASWGSQFNVAPTTINLQAPPTTAPPVTPPIVSEPKATVQAPQVWGQTVNTARGNYFTSGYRLNTRYSGSLTKANYGVFFRTGEAKHKGKGRYGLQTVFDDALKQAAVDMKAAGLGTFFITDGFRSYQQQIDTKRRRGKWAATPGNSVHGLGYASDLGLTTKQYQWLQKNGYRYGLVNLKGESWHWQLDPRVLRKGFMDNAAPRKSVAHNVPL